MNNASAGVDEVGAGDTAVRPGRSATQTQELAELPLATVIAMSMRRWRLIALFVVVSLGGYYLYINNTSFEYVAQLKLVPAPSSENSLRGGLGGLAALAGLRLNEGQNLPPFLVYTEQLRSNDVAKLLSRDPYIMHGLFAQDWDAEARRWREDHTFSGGLRNFVKRILGVPVFGWRPPGTAQVQKVLETQLEVDENKLTSVVTLEYAHTNAEFAKQFLTRLHQATDNIIRERNLRRANENIRNLEIRLRTTEVAGYRQSIAEILEIQERARMLASANVAYAAEPIGDSFTPDHPTRPRAALLLALLLAGSLLLGMATSLILELRRRPTNEVAR